jgi:hypothetical protein
MLTALAFLVFAGTIWYAYEIGEGFVEIGKESELHN